MSTATISGDWTARVAAITWPRVGAERDAQGWAILPELLCATQCAAIAARYAADEGFFAAVS